ncbi:hypothetical protein P12x_001363 [Tundrisphaera lichenicola]|uniref:hypothetical protein n=1 Tax=Tundrisphaera lichenicola TaxID=2029860 RepID=UPI003EBD0F30
MRELRLYSSIFTLALVGAIALTGQAAQEPRIPVGPVGDSDESRIPIFLNAPSDLAEFWKMLARPDFVILNGDQYRKLQGAAPQAKPRVDPSGGAIESVEVSGDGDGDWARLAISLKVSSARDGPSWTPIRLDGLNLTEVREGSKELPTRIGEGRSWEIELPGRGDHTVEIHLLAPIRSTSEGRRLDLSIPLAASTRFDLKFPTKISDANTGTNEPVVVAPGVGESGSRLEARLSPRPRIELTWRERADPAVTLPALLSAQGEIAMDVERGAIRTRSSWILGAIRGVDSQISIGLDSNEEVLDVELDERAVLFEVRPSGARSVLSIPLADPLRANITRSLVINTRRPIESGGSTRVSIQGYAFEHAKVQTGVLAIVRSGPIFLNPSPGRALRRIDPRTELPETLRARPDTALAFEFNDQPFDLGLVVEPAPPRLLVENRSTIALDPRSARIDTLLTCRTSQGRTFELAVLLPENLAFEGAGPPEVVASAQVVPLRPKEGGEEGAEVARILTITLSLQAREAESFVVQLKGRYAIDASKPVAIPLFQPMADSTIGSRFALVSERNVLAELAEAGDSTSPFRVDWDASSIDWTWPGRKPGPELGLLWLRSDAAPRSLPLKLTIRPRSIRHESTTTATFERRWVEVLDEVSGEVSFGSVNRLDIALPPEVPARWDVEGVDLAGREAIGQDPDGTRRYRLKFARDYSESFRLRIRYRIPFPEPLAAGHSIRTQLGPIRVLEGTTIGQNFRALSDPGIELVSDPKGWSVSSLTEPIAEPGPTLRITLHRPEDKPGPVAIEARLGPQLALPNLVVSRLWLRTTQRPEGDLATMASFWIVSREGSMSLALPPGARWIRSRIGGREVAEGMVEGVGEDEYKLLFPTTTPAGPVLVVVEYEVPAAKATRSWLPPRVLDGGVIQQSVWEVRLIGSRAGIGTPPGWVEENEWYWESFLYRRRPWRSPAELMSWINGGNSRLTSVDFVDGDDPVGRHSYLFGRSGPPMALSFAVFSRFALVLICSGPILLAGLLVLARKPPPRLVGGIALSLTLGIAAFAEGSFTIPMAQSALPGLALWIGALVINGVLERRDRGLGAVVSSREGNVPPSGFSVEASPGLGSDDSTAIRVRPPTPSAISTADHIVLTRIAGRPADEASTTGPRDPR